MLCWRPFSSLCKQTPFPNYCWYCCSLLERGTEARHSRTCIKLNPLDSSRKSDPSPSQINLQFSKLNTSPQWPKVILQSFWYSDILLSNTKKRQFVQYGQNFNPKMFYFCNELTYSYLLWTLSTECEETTVSTLCQQHLCMYVFAEMSPEMSSPGQKFSRHFYYISQAFLAFTVINDQNKCTKCQEKIILASN